MKLLKRNLTDFEYLPYIGEETDIDPVTGLHTGEYTRDGQYGEPEEYEGNISVPSQYAANTLFGRDVRYTHVLLMDDPDVEIDEYGKVLWNGEEYEVRAVRRSLNSVSIALKKETKDHAEPEGEDDSEPDAENDSDDP